MAISQFVRNSILQNQALNQKEISPKVDDNIITNLSNVSLGGPSNIGPGGVGSIDQLIQERTDPALDFVRGGSNEALRLSRLAQKAGTDPLEQFAGLQAFDEQQALLGTRGAAAQEESISGIPVSQFDRELNERQRKTLLRGAAASGDLGSGATLLGAQQLAGGQQADIIQRRLAELEPLVAASRGVRSTLSGIDEASRARQAQLQSGRGIQEANIRLGTTAPVIESTLQRAELSGLQGIARSNQRSQAAGQLSDLAVQFAPKIGNFVSTLGSNQPQVVPQTGLQQQFISEAGTIGLA